MLTKTAGLAEVKDFMFSYIKSLGLLKHDYFPTSENSAKMKGDSQVTSVSPILCYAIHFNFLIHSGTIPAY